MGGLGFTDPVVTSSSEYEASIEVTNPLVRRIVEQEHQPPLRCLRNSNTERAVELATGRTNWLTVIPLKELDYKLNKKEFRDAIKLRYDWEITDTPMLCACGVQFSVDHAMVCQRAGSLSSAIMICPTWKQRC